MIEAVWAKAEQLDFLFLDYNYKWDCEFTVVASELEKDFSETGLDDFTDSSTDGFTASERNHVNTSAA